MYKYFHFEWLYHPAGYEIKRVENPVAGQLSPVKTKVVKFIEPLSDEITIYKPLNEYSGLFKTFADTGTSEGDILDFANQYGPLNSHNNRLELWRKHIRNMRQALDAWESTNNKKRIASTIEKALNGKIDLRFDKITFQYQLWPRDLITAIWAQFADAVAGSKTYKQCEWCGTPFEINPRIARKNRMFCSNACKQADYRDRRSKS